MRNGLMSSPAMIRITMKGTYQNEHTDRNRMMRFGCMQAGIPSMTRAARVNAPLHSRNPTPRATQVCHSVRCVPRGPPESNISQIVMNIAIASIALTMYAL